MRATVSFLRPAPQRAIALVVVLAFLVLLSTLIVAFLTSVDTELKSAKSYQSSVTVKQLVSSATNVVTGQITEATRSTKTVRPPGTLTAIGKGERLSWASQPGMIRTWDDNGQGWKVFKLYSSRTMVADSKPDGTFSTETERKAELPDDWPSQPALFTDLNQPVLVQDPAGAIVRDTQNYRASFPIVDPLAMLKINNIEKVDGFRITPPPGFGGALTSDSDGVSVVSLSESDDPTRIISASQTANPAPMPVSWIYVLKDGTLTAPTGADPGESTVAVWDGVDPAYAPSRENPIVGRIAFWADDETCKLNVNTASEPTAWDTPRAITFADLNFGRYQPAQKEYQRFSGHPLTTALSPVLLPGVKLTPQQKQAIYEAIPRVEKGGSNSGLTEVNSYTGNTNYAVPLDEDRLFATVDEFLFGVPTSDVNARKPIPDDTRLSILKLDVNRVRRARFFLTANSRAPEINLYGQPRVSLWPVHADYATNKTSPRTTGYDRLNAFCTTLGDVSNSASLRPYYFQRRDARSPTIDYASIPRNQQLYTYLRNLTDLDVPGYGASFKSKWGDDRDQMLTQVFDYIRCVNLMDPLLPQASRYAQKNGSSADEGGQVAPISINVDGKNTKGFGRFHTISQVGMHFICSRDGITGVGGTNLPAGQRWIEAALLIEPFSPSLGWYKLNEDMFFDVKFLSAMSLDGKPLGMTSGGRALNDRINDGWHNNGRERGGSGGLRGPIQGFGGGGYAWRGGHVNRVLIDTANKTTMQFSGGDVQIDLYVGGGVSAANKVQTFVINIPAGSFPIPELVRTPTADYRGANGATTQDYWWTFANRYSSTGSAPHAPGLEYKDPTRRWVDSGGPAGFKKGGIFREEDVVRCVVPEHGDLRLIAAQSNVVGQFVPVRSQADPIKGWSSPYRFLHVFSEAVGSHTLYGNANEPTGTEVATKPNSIPAALVDDQLHGSANVKYHYSRLPEIRPGAGKIYNRWGDFDNGIAHSTDGAFINKPDEGNTGSTNSPYNYFAWNFAVPTATFFSPSRLVPSAGMLGSLPTGVKRHIAGQSHAWETLLFRPEVRKNDANAPHPGTLTPPDHVFMDLFWMPVIEPYAISEPFSTAGKINLNYEIAPFNYIKRATALYGAIKGEEPLVLPNTAGKFYKLWDHESNDHPKLPSDSANADGQVRADWTKAYNNQPPFDKMRRPVDMKETLTQWEERFTKGDLFRSATQICEMHLVREGEKLQQYRDGKIWPDALITGDNTRERPYTNLYARLTTRSNTFTVHVRAQVLRQSGGPNPEDWRRWREGRDQQLSEHRGSTIVERYIDPADPIFGDTTKPAKEVDFAQNSNLTIDSAYKMRVISTKKFVP